MRQRLTFHAPAWLGSDLVCQIICRHSPASIAAFDRASGGQHREYAFGGKLRTTGLGTLKGGAGTASDSAQDGVCEARNGRTALLNSRARTWVRKWPPRGNSLTSAPGIRRASSSL
jgi:hypothetical protein